jgi:type I restriction enzyme S subunit
VSSETAGVKESPPQYVATESEVPRGYKRDPGVIPDGWRRCSVGRMGEVLIGKALAVHAPGQLRPYLRTKNVFDGRIDIGDVLTMPMTDAQFEHFRLHPDDVLLNEGQSLDLVGRCAIYRDEFPEPCAIQNQLLRFRARAGVSPEFAAHLFRYCQQTGIFARIALQTTSIAHLGGSRFEGLLLAWPERESEQRAIAEALSDADGLLGALKALIAKKEAIKQAVMQQLLTGKTRLPGFSGEWETVTAGGIGTFTGGCGFPTTFQGKTSGQYPFFKVSDMNNEGNDTFMQRANNYIDEGLRAQLGATAFPAESIVFAKVGAAIFLERKKILAQASCLDNNMAAFVLDERVANYRFIHYVFMNTSLGELVSTTALPSLSGSVLSKIRLQLPTLHEQVAISAVLSDIDAEIAALEQRLDKTWAIKQGMMQELLTGRVRLVKPAPAEASA